MNKFLLSLSIFLCFSYGIDRLYSFYYNHVPVARVGECLELKTGINMRLKVKVLNNDIQAGSSYVSELLPGGVYFASNVRFAELRNLKAERVECDE